MEEWLGEIEEAEEGEVSEGRDLNGSMVGRRRVAITWAVGEAWEVFARDKANVVRNAFRVVGLALPIDGSEDHRLSIKGLANDILIAGLKDWGDEGQENRNPDVDIDVDSDDEINFAYE